LHGDAMPVRLTARSILPISSHAGTNARPGVNGVLTVINGTASYGRYHASVIQGFSDQFAQIAQQTNYNNYVWNGSQFVFSNRVT
jgi:hypothetical protein